MVTHTFIPSGRTLNSFIFYKNSWVVLFCFLNLALHCTNSFQLRIEDGKWPAPGWTHEHSTDKWLIAWSRKIAVLWIYQGKLKLTTHGILTIISGNQVEELIGHQEKSVTSSPGLGDRYLVLWWQQPPQICHLIILGAGTPRQRTPLTVPEASAQLSHHCWCGLLNPSCPPSSLPSGPSIHSFIWAEIPLFVLYVWTPLLPT